MTRVPIISPLTRGDESKLWKAKFFILRDVRFLMRLQKKFEIDPHFRPPRVVNLIEKEEGENKMENIGRVDSETKAAYC